MKIKVIIVLLLFVPLIYAQEEYQNYETLNINTKITSKIDLNPNVNYISSELYFFPKETDFQKITKKEYSQNVYEKSDLILYEWNNPPEELIYDIDYDIESNFNLVKIKNKISFPFEVPQEYEKYTEATEFINSDNIFIKEKAKEIIGNEDDLYEAVYKVGDWVNDNIEYSLESLTEELTQNSLWVLQNGRGVCDELTVLFIAMMRSQGIPAKFVSGSSYTDVIPGFGNHAWAEVYFPGKGWVPYDVTYGQYGYIDAAHIKMKESSDAKDPSIRYKWSPGGVDINAQPLNISTTIISTGNKLNNFFDINLKTLKDKVKSGSYLPIEIELNNNEDYYLSNTLYITKAPTSLKNNVKHVLLKPKENKKIYWVISIPDNLDNQYIYTSKIEVVDFFGDFSEIEVEYANNYIYYSLDEAQERIHQLEIENRNPESSVDVFCSPDKVKYYSYENATVICKIINTEQKTYSFDICFMDDCKDLVIEPLEKKDVIFELPLEIGIKENHINISGNNLIKNSYFDVNVIKEPELKIENLNYPGDVKYKDSGNIEFDLLTESPAKNLVIKIDKKELFRFDIYESRENFVIPFNGKYFYKENSKLIFDYEDNNGKKYSQQQEVNIKVTNVPFYVAIGYWWFLIGSLVIILFLFKRKLFRMKEPPKPMKKISKI